ncbi:MAG: hydroxyacylglutathione hydrolase [Betaproteobacteria bacterium]|nr:hydroxyacylglutathione hydrolase [Betaproteobacteria bacterium]
MNTNTDYQIVPLSAFNDNYIWLLRRGDQAAVVDPGDAAPVLAYLEREQLNLCAILATHHHGDHIGGIEDLLTRYAAPVFGPAGEPIATLTRTLTDGEHIQLPQLGADFEVMAIPGHTRAHIAYYGRNHSTCGVLFCGDTLFASGCGRVFEGTPPQMRHSLARLAALPGATRVYCAHEYTQANIRFALAVEPENIQLHDRAKEVADLRAANHPTVPTTISAELLVNPFLRWDAPAVIAAAQRISGKPLTQPDEVFAAIREWKNRY